MALDETYIQEAADRVMIQDLLGRYAFAADYGTGNPESWAALFIEDGIFGIPKSMGATLFANFKPINF